MTKTEKVNAINKAVDKYFATHSSETSILARHFHEQSEDLQNIFSSDKTMRQFFRYLKEERLLSLIPTLIQIPAVKNGNWYFMKTTK